MAGSTLASPSADPAAGAAVSQAPVSQGRDTWRRFRRHRLAMASTFVLGLLVSVVKLSAVAAVTLDVGLWGFGALTILLTALSSFDLHELWQRATELGA